MKQLIFTLFTLLLVENNFCQSLNDLKSTLITTDHAIQAIHHYPQDVKDGECHNVRVVNISIDGDNIIIKESWKNWTGFTAATTLTGKITNNVAIGTWSSNYSSGNWSYDFPNKTGKWNKTKSRFDKFNSYEKLEFRIVEKKSLRDGFFVCN